MNVVHLIGNLGKDPETKTLEGGVKVTSFTLATSKKFKDKSGNRQELTEWHNIVLFRGLAEIAEKYVKKGNKVSISGEIQYKTWDDNEGNKRYMTQILGNDMIMLGGKENVTPIAEDNLPPF
jgi:single-strand DNA-binding protein